MSTFKYKIAGKEYAVEITDVSDSCATVSVNGEQYTVELEPQAPPEKAAPVLGHAATASTPAESAPAAAPAAAEAINSAAALCAPLPGIVVDIKVQVGDKVKAGDTLVVLEAMKMANNLDAERDGTVTAICVKVGESVMEEAPLVVVE